MRGNREEKQALDRQTAYLTFLPPMDEGFHTGYHTAPGIVSDHNRRPREWLESLARCLQTPGVDVSYSIPDVLSAEQQLRRLSRLTPERALAHPSMAAWRGVLALLLLWDTWPQDGAWPALELARLSDGGTPFSASVTAALSPARAPDGLWYAAVGMTGKRVLVIEWTHGNSDRYEGVDIPVLLNSTPAETLAHRQARNRDGRADSPFTTMVLELEQQMLKAQAHKAKLILSKSGELMTYEQYTRLMAQA